MSRSPSLICGLKLAMANEENPVKKELEKPAVREDLESDQAGKYELTELKARIER
ncbi:MAG: hypothetical protein HOL36_07890 [Candidatus Marinimicrobia bacterium]|nr:hypothetical protein [Candidatus Neomarinimicrobiota bacterium]MBT7201772.1 hypothetical protein [Candidatus Neomarinimicrobiota bacterium]MBT7578973.1 hypothetical protein [Candidatus Neomarinimicrobiota bacterium]